MTRDLVKLLDGTGLLPVVTIENPETADPIAEALMAGGIPRIEVTLRTPRALEALERIAKNHPDMLVAAGTVLTTEQLRRVGEAGAAFAVSPGLTPQLLDAAAEGPLPLLPGVSSPSELMLGLEAGLTAFKFFPAEASGGVAALKALSAPFCKARFCPTGGVNLASATTYLALENVMCIGGSWIVPGDAVAAGDWARIETLAREAAALAH